LLPAFCADGPAGLLCDLLWADPDPGVSGWGANDRGTSYVFGQDVISEFLRKFDLDLICRAHQVVEDGYEFFGKRGLVTLFSAPNYCGEFDNAGAMMSIDETLLCSFQVGRSWAARGDGRVLTTVRRSSSRRRKRLDKEAPEAVGSDGRPPSASRA
jgi:hypothetical protein